MPDLPSVPLPPTRFDRPRLPLLAELQLAVLPTLTTFLMLGGLRAFSDARLLFPSLSSSAVFIYLAPEHTMNRLRSLLLGQGAAALLGFGCGRWLGHTYEAAALAMAATLLLMVLADAVHPPAAGTALTFAFRGGPDSSLLLFAAAVGLLAALAASQYAVSRLVRRRYPAPVAAPPDSGSQQRHGAR